MSAYSHFLNTARACTVNIYPKSEPQKGRNQILAMATEHDCTLNSSCSGIRSCLRYYLQSVTNPETDGFVAIRASNEEDDVKVSAVTPDKVLDSLNYNIYELSTWYVMKSIEDDGTASEKNVVPVVRDGDGSAAAGGGGSRDVGLMEIEKGGILMHWKTGDEEWSVVENVVDGLRLCYVDVVYRKSKGKFYTVDDCGNVAIVDDSLKVELVKWPVSVDQSRRDLEVKFLVESKENLYLVIERRNCISGQIFGKAYVSAEADDVRIKIYRLDDEKKKWKRVRKLGDRVFFVGHLTSFVVDDATAYPLLGKNCVYFNGTGAGSSDGQQVLCVFDVVRGFWGELSNSHGTKTGSLVALPALR